MGLILFLQLLFLSLRFMNTPSYSNLYSSWLKQKLILAIFSVLRFVMCVIFCVFIQSTNYNDIECLPNFVMRGYLSTFDTFCWKMKSVGDKKIKFMYHFHTGIFDICTSKINRPFKSSFKNFWRFKIASFLNNLFIKWSWISFNYSNKYWHRVQNISFSPCYF